MISLIELICGNWQFDARFENLFRTMQYREFCRKPHGDSLPMGIRRSTIIAGSLLIKPGYKTNDIIAHISKIRGLRLPDTDEQITWLKRQE